MCLPVEGTRCPVYAASSGDSGGQNLGAGWPGTTSETDADPADRREAALLAAGPRRWITIRWLHDAHLVGIAAVRQRRRACVAIVVGTRPEAVKMAPVCFELRRQRSLAQVVVSTGQHAELLHTALAAFGLKVDEHVSLMRRSQSPNDVAARILRKLPAVLQRHMVAAMLVQGDTTTALAATLAAFHIGVPVGHVEAGLRTFDLASPFPEEANRQLADRLARWCFAPTERARRNLLAEGIPDSRIHVVGNTAVDAVRWMSGRAAPSRYRGAILVTLHRRESFGEPLQEVLAAVREFLNRHPEARAVWPVHPNPRVIEAASVVLREDRRFVRLPALGYREFTALLRDCRFVLSDSGGVQEEAPSLGKRVLIARDVTERPEAVELGLNRLVGRARAGIVEALEIAWAETPYRGALPAPNPYGDGRAAELIVRVLTQALQGRCAT